VPITRVYSPDAGIAGGIAADTGRGNLRTQLQQLAQQEAFKYAQLGEQQRQYDLGIAQRGQQGYLDRQFGYTQLAQRGQQFQQGLQADIYARQLAVEGGLAQQELQNRGYEIAQQAANQRTIDTQLGQLARQQQTQQFEKAMADRKGLEQFFLDGKITPQQLQAGRDQWEQIYGMPWSLPDEMAQQQAGLQEQQEMATFAQAMANPITGELPFTPEAIGAMRNAGMSNKEIMDAGMKKLSEERQHKKLQFDVTQGFEEERRKDEEVINDRIRDNERADQKMRQEQEMAQLRVQIQQMQHQQKMQQAATGAYYAAYAKWAAAKSSFVPGEEGGTFNAPEPKMEDFMPPEGAASPAPQLKAGDTEITAPNGKKAILHADGTVTPL
jgi:hypothetical protein